MKPSGFWNCQKEYSPNKIKRLLNQGQEWIRQRSLFSFSSRAGNQTAKPSPSSTLPFKYFSVSYLILLTQMASQRTPQESSKRQPGIKIILTNKYHNTRYQTRNYLAWHWLNSVYLNYKGYYNYLIFTAIKDLPAIIIHWLILELWVFFIWLHFFKWHLIPYTDRSVQGQNIIYFPHTFLPSTKISYLSRLTVSSWKTNT